MSTVLIIRTARRKPVLPASSAGFVPAGELDPAMKPAEHQQSAGGQQQMACGQEPGGDQTNHQHRAADQQHSEGGQTAPLRRGEVFSVAIAFLLCVGISRRCAASQSTPIVIYTVTVSYYISCGVKFPSLFVTKL